MKYSWDIKELRDNLLHLNELKSKVIDKDIIDNIDNIDNIDIMIDTYKQMLSYFNKKNRNEQLLDDEINFTDFKSFIDDTVESFSENDIEILNVILNTFYLFKENYNPNTYLKNPQLVITNKDLFDITHDFYQKMTPPDIYKRYTDIFDKPNNITHIYYGKTNKNYSGITLFDPFLDKKYILCARCNNLLDLVVIPHESFHYLFNNCDTYLTLESKMTYTTEIEGSFANILFSDYFYHNASENNSFFHNYFLENYNYLLSELLLKSIFLDSLNNNKKFRLNKFNKYVNFLEIEKFNSTKEIMEYIECPLYENIKYAFSYLIAIDLYYIYLKDRDFAFYLLQNIRYIKKENDVFTLLRRNHITFMDDGYSNFEDYIKKVGRLK